MRSISTTKSPRTLELISGGGYRWEGVHTLQLVVQNAAVQLLMGLSIHQHSLRDLYWLPNCYQAKFNVLLSVYKALNSIGPVGLWNCLSQSCPLDHFELWNGRCGGYNLLSLEADKIRTANTCSKLSGNWLVQQHPSCRAPYLRTSVRHLSFLPPA